jgi:pectate lyase
MRNFSSLIIILFIMSDFIVYAQLPAFPSAEGGGMYSAGGRGGKVIFVTNLNDNGDGSLRNAVNSTGARTIIFEVSGTIELDSPLTIRNDSITIAGQTAPGDGICVKNYSLEVAANNIIIRFIRVRLGDETKYPEDAMSGIYGNNNIIIDHCSVSWGIDEVMTFWNNNNLTVQWCIISESLIGSHHPKGSHGYGAIWGGTNATYHHNLIAHHSSRTPRFSGGTTVPCDGVDFVNNVIYNWGYNGVYGGEKGKVNIINNYFKPGPATKQNVRSRILEPFDDKGKWYIDGNAIEGFPVISKDNWSGGIQGEFSESDNIRELISPAFENIVIDSPEMAYKKVLQYSGAILPKRDVVDERVIFETKTGTATFSGRTYSLEHKLSTDIITGIIDSQTEVGGWPELKSLTPPIDSDNDGIPDIWEIENGLDPLNADDRNHLAESGYTFLEEYLNSLVTCLYDN